MSGLLFGPQKSGRNNGVVVKRGSSLRLKRNPALRTPPPPPLLPTLSMVPSVSVLTGFDCLDFQDLAGGGGRGLGPQQSCPLTFKFVLTKLKLTTSLACETLMKVSGKLNMTLC